MLDSGEIKTTHDDSDSEVDQGETEHAHRVLGGHKAAINNPRVSSEAKDKAREFVGSYQDGNGTAASTTGHRTVADIQADKELDLDLKGKDPQRVLRGFKSAVKNPRVSDEKREHAEKAIEALEQL